MLPYIFIRILVPIYLIVLFGLNLKLINTALTKEITIGKFIKQFFLNYVWFLLIFSEEGRLKLNL